MSMPVDGVGPLLAVPAIAILAFATRAASAKGAVAGCAVGAAVAGGAGWAGFAMLATLLFAGTAVSAKGSRRRGATQVLCNGGVAAAAALLAGSGVAWGVAAASGALATALSDTASAELGRRFGGRPRALLFGPPLERGADGGMSPLGTLLGAAAALPVPLVGLALGALPDLGAACRVALAALAGNALDSVLGLRLQPHLGRRGNDWVNLASTLGGAALAAV